MIIFFINSLYSLFYGMELSQTELRYALFFIRVQHIFLPFSVTFVLLFSIEFTGYFKKFFHQLLPILFIVPIITLFVGQTNDYHQLMYSNPTFNQGEFYAYTTFEVGFWYEIQEIYDIVFLFASISMFLYGSFFTHGLFRKQHILLSLALLMPLLALLLPILNIVPYGLDTVPYSLTITIAIIYISFYRTQLFNLIPQARAYILDQLQEAILVIDKDTKIIDFNHAWIQNFSKEIPTLGEPLTRDSLYFLDSDSANIILKNENSLNLKFTREIEGMQSWFFLTATKFWNKTNTYQLGTIIKIQDVTEMSRANARIQQQNENLRKINAEKDLLFSVIAHDLRSPLSGLVGFSELLEEELDTMDIDEVKQSLTSFHSTSRNLYDLVNNLLEWSKFQIDNQSLDLKEFSIKKSIENSIHIYRDILDKKNIQVDFEADASLNIICDENHLSSIIRNIFYNAIKFSPTKSRIAISAKTDTQNQEVCILIEDFGIGIPESMLPKLFDFSEKTGRPGTNNEPTSGLGLPLVKEFLTKMGGRIEVESEVGRGSRFSIYLPIVFRDRN